MKIKLSVVCITIIFAFLVGNVSYAQKAPKDSKIKMCNSCHKEGKNKFDEYKTWLYKMHSDNVKLLKSEKSEEIAKLNKVKDAVKDETCTKCHQNKFDKEMKFKPNDIKCDDCHDVKSKIHTIKDKVPHPTAG